MTDSEEYVDSLKNLIEDGDEDQPLQPAGLTSADDKYTPPLALYSDKT